MSEKTVVLKRENICGAAWESFCYYLGLIGNSIDELGPDHFKSITITVNNIEKENEAL